MRRVQSSREFSMSFRSVAAKNVVMRMVGVVTVAGAALVIVSVTNEFPIRAQSRQIAAPPVRLPDEAAGFDGIARTLISAFDQADIVQLTGAAADCSVDRTCYPVTRKADFNFGLTPPTVP